MSKKFIFVFCGFLLASFFSGTVLAGENSANPEQPSYRRLLDKLYFAEKSSENPDIELKERDREPPPRPSPPPHRSPQDTPKAEPSPKKGRLESFEQPYSESKSKKKRHKDNDDDDDNNSWPDFVCSCASEINLIDLLFPTEDEDTIQFNQEIETVPAAPAESPSVPEEDYSESPGIGSHLEANFIDIDNNLWAYNYILEWRAHLVNVEFSLTQYVEDIGNRTDHLDFGKFIVSTNMLRNNKNKDFSLDIGAGIAGLSGEDDFYGAALELNAKMFVQPKYSLSLSGTYAYIDSNNTFELDAKLGVFLRHLQLTGGYHTLISEQDSLHGPEIGLAIWFW
ncbi:MAG: hypothetical protein HZA48_11305 [Planctomycetes bacterium]|nr:hypothetical protein [Planctomycetota bacterium]